MKNVGLIRGLVAALTVFDLIVLGCLWWGLLGLPTDQVGGLTSATGLVVTHLNVPAETSQLELGDVLVHIRGYTLEEWAKPNLERSLSLLRDSREGQWVAYTVRRGEALMDVELPLVRITPMDVLSRIALTLPFALVFLLVGAFVAWRRPHDQAARVIFLLFWALVLNFSDDPVHEASMTWLLTFNPLLHSVEFISFWFVISLGLHFSLVFPRPHPWLQRFPWLLWVVHLINPIVSVGVVLLLGKPLIFAMMAGPAESVRYVVGGVLAVWAALNLVRSFRLAQTPVERAQMRWLAWGAMVGFGPWLVGFIVPLVVGGLRLGILQGAFFWLFMIAVPLALAFAILRYRLMDIDAVIHRSLVYGALSAVLVGVYLLLATGLGRLVVALSGQPNDSTVIFLSTLGAAAVFTPARARIQTMIDGLFYRQKLNLPALLAEWSKTLAMTLDIHQLTALMVETVPARLNLEQAGLWMWNEAEGRFITPKGDLLVDGQGAHTLAKEMLTVDAPVFVNPPDVPPDPNLAPLRDVHLEIVAPLVVSSKLVGLYAAGAKRSGTWYNRAEVEFLETLSHQAAIALENSRSYQTIARQVGELATLHALGRAISAELDMNGLVNLVLQQVTTTLGFDRALMMIVDQARQVLTKLHGVGGDPAQLELLALLEIPLDVQKGGLFADVLLSGRSRLIEDATLESSGPLGWMVSELGTRAFALVPLRVQDKPVGLLGADRVSDRPIHPDEVRLLDTLASQVAVAVQNARLVEQLAEQERLKRELEIARTIQTSLLPAQEPQWPGLEVYGMSLPAREVGGDFYSYLTLPNGAAAVAVGDISGKGVPGALFMAVALGVMRAQAAAFNSASELLQALNAALYEQMINANMNAALIYTILEPAGEGRWLLRASNGGMVAPLLAHDGKCEYLDVSGLPLGAALYASFEEVQARLAPGDVLVLCSDGIVEAMDARRRLFSFSRLQQALSQLNHSSAAEIAAGLVNAARAFADGVEFEDDVTLVVVRVKARE